jgi:hypothetical protein
MKNRSCDKCLKTLERVKGFPRGHIGLLPRYVLVRNSGCYLIAASSNNLGQGRICNLTSADSPNACPRDELSYAALCSQKYQSEERCTRPFNVAGQAEPVAVEIFDRQFAGRLLTGLFECDRRQRTIGLVLAGRAIPQDKSRS